MLRLTTVMTANVLREAQNLKGKVVKVNVALKAGNEPVVLCAYEGRFEGRDLTQSLLVDRDADEELTVDLLVSCFECHEFLVEG